MQGFSPSTLKKDAESSKTSLKVFLPEAACGAHKESDAA